MEVFGGMSEARLLEIIAGFSKARIAVLGDFFLDKYLDVDPVLAETSLETGKTAHQVVAVRHSPGAAGTVVNNLAALGACTLFAVGFTGDDGEGYELRQDLGRLGCNTEHLFSAPDRHTPTYCKPRDASGAGLASEHPRYDIKNRTPTSVPLQERLVAALDAVLPLVDAVIVADQVDEHDCGVVTDRIIDVLADRPKRLPRMLLWADSRRRIGKFRRVVVKPNQFEAVGWADPPPGAKVETERLLPALAEFRRKTGAPVVVTLGAEGILVSDPGPTRIPAVRVEGPIDSTGAGDSTTAGMVLALVAGASYPEAALVGNLVASITIEQLSTTGTARPEELPPRLEKWRRGSHEADR